MAQDVGTLTLYREKSLFFDGAHPGPDLEPFARLAIRSNRVVCALASEGRVRRLVVRGHNIPTTLRLAGRIVDVFKADRMALDGDSAVDWQTLSDAVLSDYDRAFVPETWLAAYVDGACLYASKPLHPAFEVLEAESKGGEIDEAMLKRLAPRLVDIRSTRLRHDSRAAVVMNESSDGVRCAVIERRRGKDAAFSFHVQNPPRKRLRLSVTLYMAADLFELQNLYALAERVQRALAEAQGGALPFSLDQVEAITMRNAQLSALIKSFHESHAVRYRPAPPAYLPVGARI